jgi:hypothetical protein
VKLWDVWTSLVLKFQDAFSRKRSFLLFALVLAGFVLRTEHAGVTSFVRALGLKGSFYHCLLRFFRSKSVNLVKITTIWVKKIVLQTPDLITVNGRIVLLLDGVQAIKSGRRMPGVKTMYQSSADPNTPTFPLGHQFQALVVLIGSLAQAVAIPLTARIHQGIEVSPFGKKSLLERALELIQSLELPASYLVADAYYNSGRLLHGLVGSGHHMITRIKHNSVAFAKAAPCEKKGRGRPRRFGQKIVLQELFGSMQDFSSTMMDVYGRPSMIKYLSVDLICRSFGDLVRYVLVVLPDDRRCILMTTDLTCDPRDVIKLYTLRFKIEGFFRQTKQRMGTFLYHFWTKAVDKSRRSSTKKTQYLHRMPAPRRRSVLATKQAYEVYVQSAFIAQGLLLLLSHYFAAAVWSEFRGWMRSIRADVSPSEAVVQEALITSFPRYFRKHGASVAWLKLLSDNLDVRRGSDRFLAQTG